MAGKYTVCMWGDGREKEEKGGGNKGVLYREERKQRGVGEENKEEDGREEEKRGEVKLNGGEKEGKSKGRIAEG